MQAVKQSWDLWFSHQRIDHPSPAQELAFIYKFLDTNYAWDQQQKKFAMLSGFCLLRKKTTPRKVLIILVFASAVAY